MLKIGDWVTQYSKGYWQIIDIKPKYAEEDYQYENGFFQKKGDLIGSWVLMKKGFTPKMKFMRGSDVCDSEWCKAVSADVAKMIDNYFQENPADYEKFSSSPFVDRPAVSTTWLHLTPDEVVLFERIIKELPTRFTRDYAMKCFEKQGLKKCFSLPPANYRFVCWHTLWELDDDFNPIYKNPELRNN